MRGPFNSDQLREFAKRGKIRPDDRVRQGSNGPWRDAASIPGLFVAPRARQPATVPQGFDVAPVPPPVAPTTAPQKPPPMFPDQIACPNCRRLMANDLSLQGQIVACPFCGGQFQIPAIAAPVHGLPTAGPAGSYSSPPPTRRKRKKRNRTAFWLVLCLAVTVVSVGGVGMVMFERGLLSFDIGDSEASARATLSAELDKWMARQDHDAKHVEVFMAILLDYHIQSLQRVETKVTDLGADWDDYLGRSATKAPPATYLATVRVNVESKTGTALPRVILYRLTRDPKARKWRIWGTMDGG